MTGFKPYGEWKRTGYWLVVLGWCMFLAGMKLGAQDVHYSQFYSNPLGLNPGLTGFYEGNYRIGFNAKLQWPWAISSSVYNYHSESPYVDFSFGERRIKVGWFGIGAHFLNDQAGDGRLTYRRIGLSAAYHQAFDKDHRYVLSAGVGLNYVIRSIDFAKLYFNNQWVDDIGFDLNVNNSEPLQRETFGMLDMNAGINFNAYVHEQVKLEAGFALMHLNRPRHTFLGTTERIGLRYQANAGITGYFNERTQLALNAYYGYEKKASEIMLNVLFGYSFYGGRRGALDHTIYTGLNYRIKDALAPVIGYQFKQTRILLSYDVTLSKLINASKANGGPEVSIVHVGSFTRSFGGRKVFCPSFKR